MREAVPDWYSLHVKAVARDSVHSKNRKARSANDSFRASSWLIFVPSLDPPPTISRPSDSVTTSIRDVAPARVLSLPPPTMNCSVAPLRNSISFGVPP